MFLTHFRFICNFIITSIVYEMAKVLAECTDKNLQ